MADTFLSLPDFWVRACLLGVLVALMAAPLGCVMVWRRMSYFGDSLSHSGLLGVCVGLALGINISLGVLLCALAFASVIIIFERYTQYSTDTILGILSHSTLALGLVMISMFDSYRLDLLSFLYGDILSVSQNDLWGMLGLTFIILLSFIKIWPSLISICVHKDLAKVEGVNVNLIHFVYVVLLASFITLAMKSVGILLITAMLIIPAAAARRFAHSPEGVIGIAGVIGILSVLLGLSISLWIDVPSGPMIVVMAMCFFITSLFKKL